MAESPALHVPLDPKEQPILDSVLHIRDELSILKSDRSNYIRSEDVLAVYDKVIEQVHRLNDVRKEKHTERDSSNRLDRVLEDCFQLISLFFMTIGRTREAPAGYAFTSTMKRLLDHLKEAGFYAHKDLEGLDRRIEDIRDSVTRGKGLYSEHLLTLLSNRLDNCQAVLNDLKAHISRLSPQLAPTWEKLVSILRSMAAANTRKNFPEADVLGWQTELKEMEATMVDGKFPVTDGSAPEDQDIVVALLKRCLVWADKVLEKRGQIDPRFAEPYLKLKEIRNQLEKLSLTQAWSLRETDLYSYQRQLDRIDESRQADGNFLGNDGKPAELHAQRTLLYLLRRSYAYIYSLIISSEPVSEALLPVYNQLQTLRRCLLEVQRSGGCSSPRELYPYSMKLNSIDNMRVDGKFHVGTDIPEGQGAVNVLLADCFELAYELRVQAEENSEAENSA